MSTELHTFINIFESAFHGEGNFVQLKKIIIPIIQRDYAQGRKDPDVDRVRKRFLVSLKRAVEDKPITLDFIYGDIDDNGVMTPLDGQQRLTTLFLLHWYAAKRDNIAPTEYEFLGKFSYETRYSARDFCELLVAHNPSFAQEISAEIIDQSWFPLDWLKDPTISSMLVMLDDIQRVFADVENIWQCLSEGAISFYFLPIKDMGLTDELYIKMNSRGKPLTRFEHFKAELEHGLREIDETVAKRVMRKIDIDWTDMLWQYRGEDNVTDDEFLRYFRFVCDIICYQSGETLQGRKLDEFDLQHEFFSMNAPNVLDNIAKLEMLFDCWCDLDGVSPKELMEKFASSEHRPGKIKMPEDQIDLFGDCLRNYADVMGRGNRSFPLNRIILLFAVVTYLQHRNTISESQFARRLRVLNNLIQNSEFQIRDGASGTRMPAIIKQTETLIVDGEIDGTNELALNKHQIEEELQKMEWLKDNMESAETVFALEDHDLLRGQIGIVGLENLNLFPRFTSLFDCDWDLVNKCLMTIGWYAKKEQGWRHQLGARANANAWRMLFHKTGTEGYGVVRDVLLDLLQKSEVFSNVLLSEMVNEYITKCEDGSEFPLQYYYIKYDLFRPSSFGKYSWEDYLNKPYEVAVMQTESKWSENTYQPFLKVLDSTSRLAKNYSGQRIVIGDNYLVCHNSAYVVKNSENDQVVKEYLIAQNEYGIDVENRIEKMRVIYPELLSQES